MPRSIRESLESQPLSVLVLAVCGFACSKKAFMERWTGPDAEVARSTRWPHHVRAKINVVGDFDAIFCPIANATRGLDPATMKKLIAQHELVVAVYPGGFALSRGTSTCGHRPL
jgi:hypothetical protein